MTETADVVIVGGGLEGAAAAWALSRRGVTDVVVAERNTVGSGMTGKSSGIVRCHYGVSSLAAMAADGLEVFENGEDIFGTDIGFRQTGYVVGVGEQNVESLRKSLAAQRAVPGIQGERRLLRDRRRQSQVMARGVRCGRPPGIDRRSAFSQHDRPGGQPGRAEGSTGSGLWQTTGRALDYGL